jgi:hypothetical protein
LSQRESARNQRNGIAERTADRRFEVIHRFYDRGHMFTVHLRCPHCGKNIHVQLHSPVEYFAKKPIPLGTASSGMQRADRPKGEDPIRGYGVSSCPECRGPVMIWFECPAENMRLAKETNHISWKYFGASPKILGIYPTPVEPDDSPHYPEALRPVFIELQEDIQADRTAPRIVVGCRSVLEIALKELGCGDKKDNLSKRIDKARENGILTESMRQWAHRIRLDGNEAAHELNANSEEAKEFVDFLRGAIKSGG